MSTLDNVLLIVLTSLMSLFFILGIALMIVVLKLVASVRTVVNKAENVVDSVEEVAEVFKDTGGRLAFFKLVRNILKLVNNRRGK